MSPTNRPRIVSTSLMFPEPRASAGAVSRLQRRRGARHIATPLVAVLLAAMAIFGAAAPGIVTAAQEADGTLRRIARQRNAITVDPLEIETPAEFALADPLVTLPADAEVRTIAVTAGTSGGVIVDGAAAFNDTARLVYSNTLGTLAIGPQQQFPEAILADDITTLADEGCSLDRYSVLVTGDVRLDDVDDGPFSVDLALYDACPRAGGAIIPGTEAQVTLPNDGLFAIVVVVPTDAELPIPNSFYVSVSFSRLGPGWILGAPALVGVSANRFDHSVAPCRAKFIVEHASAWSEVYVREPCRKTFPGYLNTNHGGFGYSPGGGSWFFDDIRLGVFPCDMTALEVAGKGNGVVLFSLRTELVRDAPDTGGLILGTLSGFALAGGNQITFGRVEFDPPIPAPAQDLFVAFKTTSSTGGPVVTRQQAAAGDAKNIYIAPPTHYNYGEEFDPLGYGPKAFDVTITCAGQAPVGACCDMLVTDQAGDSVCREVPRMNCRVRELWKQGATCESTCVGGDRDAFPCTRQADCPGGTCPGPFEHPCGLGVCCTPEDNCESLTRNECQTLAPAERPLWWLRSYFCDDEDFTCPFFACGGRVGACRISHEAPGCRDPFCCGSVCHADPFCCTVEWDWMCVWEARRQSECNGRPSNDQCLNPTWIYGRAFSLDANAEVTVDALWAAENETDSAFSCHLAEPGSKGFGTVWFKFQATETSARIHTCNTPSPGADSLLQVFRVGDGATPETECDHLEPMVCSDDVFGCGTGRSSDLCVEGLVPGETYYVELAAKTEEAKGLYQLDIESPCGEGTPPRCPTVEIVFLDPPSGVVDARRPEPLNGHDVAMEGIDTLLVAAPPEAYREVCWSVCESANEGIVNLEIAEVSAGREGTFTILLDRAITPGVVTTITYTDDHGTESTARFIAHPANVSGDVVADVQDLAAMLEILGGTRSAPWGIYSTDCDHSGSTTSADLLCLVDLLQSPDAGQAGWNDTPIPQDTGRCERVCGGASGITCPDGQFCKVPVGACGGAFLGFCTNPPTNCAENFDPVCACDGMSYDNECLADTDNVSIAHHGGCAP